MTRQQRRAQARPHVKRETHSQATIDEMRLRILSQAIQTSWELDELLGRDSLLVADPLLQRQVRARIQAMAPHLRDM